MKWLNAETQVKQEIPDVLEYRQFNFRLAGRNILHTAVSDGVMWYTFACQPDNRGTTVNIPAPGYHFWAVQQNAQEALASYVAWTWTAIHPGCVFVHYGVAANSSHPTHLSKVRYLRTGNTNNNNCNWDVGACRQIWVKDTSTVGSLWIKLGFRPREDSTWVYAPMHIRIFQPPPDLVYDATRTKGVTVTTSLASIGALLTPSTSHPL